MRQFALGPASEIMQFNEILIRCSDAAVALGRVLCSPYMRLICGSTCTGNAFLLNDDTLILYFTVTYSTGQHWKLEKVGPVARTARIALTCE